MDIHQNNINQHDGIETVQNQSYNILTSYLFSMSSLYLDIEEELYNKALSTVTAANAIKQFLVNPQHTIIVLGVDDDSGNVSITLELNQRKQEQAVVFIKKKDFSIDEQSQLSKSLRQNLQVFSANDVNNELNPFQMARSCIKNALMPILNEISTAPSTRNLKSDSLATRYMDEDFFVKTVQKKLDDLDMMLLRNKGIDEVPEVKFIYDDNIKKAVNENPSATIENIPSAILNDHNFHAGLAELVNKWAQMSSILIKHSNEVVFESLRQEIDYWINYRQKLLDLNEQLKQPEVLLTIEVLKQKKKFNKVNDLAKELSLPQRMEQVNSIVNIIQDIEVGRLEKANDLETLSNAMQAIFNQIKKLFSNYNYPPEKCMKMLENFSRDLTKRLVEIFKTYEIMRMDLKDFDELYHSVKKNIVLVWSNQINIIREYFNQNNTVDRTRLTSFVFKMSHSKFSDRIRDLLTYRETHQNIKSIIQQIYMKDDGSADKTGKFDIISEKRIEDTFEENFINNIDIFDLSKKGDKILDQAKKKYDIEIDSVEKEIIMKIREFLGSARNYNEMFKIFSKFSSLMTRPQVKTAVQEYQDQLVKKIQNNTNYLNTKYKNRYEKSGGVMIGKFYGILNISGNQIWGDQIAASFQENLSDLEVIWGDKLRNSQKGQDMLKFYDNFMKRKEQIEKTQNLDKTDFQFTGKLLCLEPMHRTNSLRLSVNFSQETQIRICELRNIIKNNKLVQTNLSKKYYFKKSAWPIFVNALKLIETVKIWNFQVPKIDEKMTQLLANQLKKVYVQIEKGFMLEWSYKDHTNSDNQKFFNNFYEEVQSLEQATNFLYDKMGKIEECVKQLSSCENEFGAYQAILNEIQEMIDELLLKEFTNIEFLVNEINERVEKVFLKRLTEMLTLWTEEFKGYKYSNKKSKAKLITNYTLHEILVKDKTIYIEPSIQHAREYWLNDLHSRLNIFACQKKLRVNRYNFIIDEDKTKSAGDFSHVVDKLSVNLLTSAYKSFHEIVNDAEKYVKTWLSYQALWDIRVDMFYDKLGNDLKKWQTLLNDIKQGRQTFDTSDFNINFGPVVINYKTVQNTINILYDSISRDILNEFGHNFVSKVDELYSGISDQLMHLEKINFGDSNNIVDNISTLNFCKQNVDKWEDELHRCIENEKLLVNQKYHFGDDYKGTNTLNKEFYRFKQAYINKANAFDSNIENLKASLGEQETTLMAKLNEIETIWNNKKPFSSEMHPKEAVNVLETLETIIIENKNKLEKLNRAKELLKMQEIDLDLMNVIIEDSSTLRELWNIVDSIWVSIDGIMEIPFEIANTVKITKQLDEVVDKLGDVPEKFKMHDIIIGKKREVQSIKKKNRLIKDIKSDAIKHHHLTDILKILNIAKEPNDLLIGDLYNINILVHEKRINDIVAHAQGELVLENMLNKIKDYWFSQEFQTSNYQDKCQLIKCWDDIMERAEEDLAHLNSMKLSQHFRTFEADIKTWHDKIQNISNVLSVWMDVQRKWVYLEGIFMGSSDIKTQLRNEYDKFGNINREFINIMKQMANKLRILDVVAHIPNLLKTLEFLSETLDKVQKNLSEYLETQRQAFSRFYFVGDEDLLEIIGNSKEIASIQKYFSKMFAGINSINTKDDGKLLVGMASKENEQVPFDKAIDLANYEKINLWLTELDNMMKLSLGTQLELCIADWKDCEMSKMRDFIEKYPTQTVLLGFQTYWTFLIEDCIMNSLNMEAVLKKMIGYLSFMAEEVLNQLPNLTRKRYEQLITEIVHKRDVTRILGEHNNINVKDFQWQYYMRYYLDMNTSDKKERLRVKMGNSEFPYGHEYLGITDKLVQTPLTDKCYFTLTQALWLRMGGAPFGPAGTGKTESVKALGCNLGRFVLVFNCDETFNFKAMGRIFIGLCQVGAWGCFDEFNRLEERILSAVSQQILSIQTGLREKTAKIDLMNKQVFLNPNMGVFVTMNPGYAGRSNLPENLKQLFRQMAMIKPDSVLIAQVMLFSQGFKSAEELSGKVVALFELCSDQLSSQPHYDFGLRALKSVLKSAGNLKRKIMSENSEDDPHKLETEQRLILRSFSDTVIPKLISEDGPLLKSLIQGVFPSSYIPPIDDPNLMVYLDEEFNRRFLNISNEKFIEKVLQLNQILKLQHGVMLVGPTGCGKSAAWKSLLAATCKIDNIKGESYIIDPKAISKDELYGRLDNTTMEWTDGIFTHVVRKIVENQRGESSKRHWIIFDGDVDPEWAENLNSVLDDNKLLTLPNGERLAIPSNVRLLFEVESLKYATLATVSRCGMVWFSEDILTSHDIYNHYLERLTQENYDSLVRLQGQENLEAAKTREICVDAIREIFIKEDGSSLANIALDLTSQENHIMEFSRIRVLEALFALIRKGVNKVVEQDEIKFGNYMASPEIAQKFIRNWTVFAINWAFAGDLKLQERSEYFEKLQASVTELPEGFSWPPIGNNLTLIDYEVRIEDGEFSLWKNKVPNVDIPPEKVTSAELIIPTVDTLRHQEVLCSWLLEHRPFIICGPPGSGKTMTLMSTLKNLQDFDMIFVNFSSSTNPQLILKQFEHYCEYFKSGSDIILRPRQPNKWLVVFCDEINLPDEDKYGTQCVITFLRQLTEQHGFWRSTDKQWISLERIQFVGACNPPTDAGRHPLAPRFLRHSPLILVDFPGYESLMQIYGTFNRGMLKRVSTLKPFADSLTTAMIEYYTQSQRRFTSDQQPHYIYSPRELTRWKYALNEALETVVTLEDLVRLWAHEALRLFEDRLVNDTEKKWCQEKVDEIASQCFPGLDFTCLQRPIIYSTYITKSYQSCSLEELRSYILEKLKMFNEEEFDVQLVVFDEVVDHIVKIDRVLKQPIGHMLLVGASGVGKTTLSKFVSWINGLKVFQIKAGRNYSLNDFDADLREVMKRAGCKLEKITFIFDESNVLSVAFLERMNALLASGEVPGLFEGDEYLSLISTYKEAQGGNKINETEDEIYNQFIKNVQRNLHVVFTMNPANPDFSNRTASSPAIFNRCVIDWFGDWSEKALYQVAKEITEHYDYGSSVEHSVIVELIVRIHKTVVNLNEKMRLAANNFNYLTPRDFLDFIGHFMNLLKEKNDILNEQQTHLNQGLTALKETEQKVFDLKKSLNIYEQDLNEKKKAADDKLVVIMDKQKQSKEKIDESVTLSTQIDQKKVQIEERKGIVEKELEEVGPALEKAQKSVSSISNAQLNEVKNYKVPPARVVMVLEAVIYLIKGKKLEWNDIKSEMTKSGFIDSVLSFDINKVSSAKKDKLKNDYVQSKDWDVKAIYSSSKAAGPLADWLESQLKYADILTQVKPLNDEIESLANENQALEDQQAQLTQTIKELEENIKEYKKEYAELISQTEELKAEKENVQNKIGKSESLLMSLSSEKSRWEISSKEFVNQFKTLTGDVLLSSAFLTYLGFFDQYYRELLFGTWKNYLTAAKIPFKKDLSLIEFLSLPSERISWQSKGLPADDLCMQNAIVLKRYNRYPLIIDPSGQAIDYIINLHSEGEKKIVRTSFIDEGYMKQLETCLRFGIPILFQDVEKIEPILNSVLNKEIVKQGGRVLVRVGDQEIDFNENFKLFMITRNSEAKFTPDICSRVTFVNFTVTKASLENQFINIYLKSERPDVEEKRLNLLKLQGEFIVKLRQLEDDLLNELSSTEGGNILENEEMIQKLANLKTQSTKIEEEMSKSDEVLEEIEQVTEEYKVLATISSKLYFTLQTMKSINPMYQYSLKFYMNIINRLLRNNAKLHSLAKDAYSDRIKTIKDEIFLRVFEKVNNSVLEEDKLLFALRFAQISIETVYGGATSELFKLLYTPGKIIDHSLPDSFMDGKLEKASLLKIEDLNKKKGFEGLIDTMEHNKQQWVSLLNSHVPTKLEDFSFVNYEGLGFNFESDPHLEEIANTIIDLLITNILNPHFAINKIREFINVVLGKEFLSLWSFDLKAVIEEDADCKSPILFASAPGFDPSSKIYELAKSLNKHYDDVAIGSAEGFELANRYIEHALKTGTWVILKNVHLAPTWLRELEQDLYRANPHENFRIFLLMEFSDKVPVTLLRQSIKFIFELPDGVKASVRRTYNTLYTPIRSDKNPKERCRLHFLLAWVHAIIMERLRYTPTGWSKKYEFSEADQKCALDIIDEYIDLQGSKQNISLECIPFHALRSVITNNVYGGKIDNEFDLKILKSIVDHYINMDSFDPKNPLVQDKDCIINHPDAVTMNDFKHWIETLEEQETPSWAGLPPSADDLLKIIRANHLLVNLHAVQDSHDEKITEIGEAVQDVVDKKVTWLNELNERVKIYKEILPESLEKLERNEESIKNPLFRFLEREYTVSSSLLKIIRNALTNIEDMCEGRVLAQQETKKLAETIQANEIPKFWRKYIVPVNLGFSDWIKDFKDRISQLQKLLYTSNWQCKGIDIGEFLFPEAFITASRQFVAQKNKISMDELKLNISLVNKDEVDDDSFLVSNMWIDGVNWIDNEFKLSDEMSHHLRNIKFTWVKCKANEEKSLNEGEIFVPLYLNSDRQNLIMPLKVDISKSDISEKTLYQRGMAFIAWKQ